MTPQQFIAKWQAAQLSERSACQQHFLDLCDLLGEEKPAAADPEGAWYCFERGVSKTEGGNGWADVWMRGHFGWEYKGKHKDLAAAFKQLLQYRESLENPPLLVVSDLNRFEIHTNLRIRSNLRYARARMGCRTQTSRSPPRSPVAKWHIGHYDSPHVWADQPVSMRILNTPQTELKMQSSELLSGK